MSGILGLLHLDGGTASTDDLRSMASLLERRGPDRTGLWCEGPAGLGHALLTTTPELAFERQPFRHDASGCAITADVRLDNRDELLSTLGLSHRAAGIGDAELIVEAYLAWGEDGFSRLHGDFAFAIWDPARQAMIGARDPFGMRPFYYHHAPGRLLALASEPRAVLVLPQVPYRINEGRVADSLVWELEWIDYTSTFFEGVFRLPPAHCLRVTRQGITVRPYWTLEPGPELRLPSDEAYAEALLDVFAQAVRSRLRSHGRVGSMLSGGLDSSSAVAVARDILASDGSPRLSTFSGVGPDPRVCTETRAVHDVLAANGLDAHLVDYSTLDDLMPELEDATWNLDEPFDFWLVLARALYMTARRRGVAVMLDGVAGDTVLSDGGYPVRLLREGHWWRGLRELRALDLQHGNRPCWANPLRAVRAAVTPNLARRLKRRFSDRGKGDRRARASLISPEFARRVSLGDRLRTLEDTNGSRRGWVANLQEARAAAIHPNLIAGRERYDRVASAWAIEPRDPYLDRRVVAFCVSLPGPQRLHDGWTKVVMRRAMAGRLPDSVRWRPGRDHLGWLFQAAVFGPRMAALRHDPQAVWAPLEPFVDRERLRTSWTKYFNDGDEAHEKAVRYAASLSTWLRSVASRPVAKARIACYPPDQ